MIFMRRSFFVELFYQNNETIKTLDIKGEVEIQYEDSKWHISN